MKFAADFLKLKENQEKISMLTAYDYPSARLAEQAGVDMILVGDSLGMVVLGYDSTVPVTMEDMIHHTKAVKRGAPNTFIVTDLPFLTYHTTVDEALKNAARLMQEAGADAVKVEGAGDVVTKMKAMTSAGIPVVAHLGLTPQSVGVLGGYKVQGKTSEAAIQLLDDARKCEEAGAMAVVLECVPYQVAENISKQLTIPTIGIGAGNGTDGQVLVYHDVLLYGVSRVAKFVKSYADLNDVISHALTSHIKEVKSGVFPSRDHSFTMKEEEIASLYGGER